MTSIFNNIDKVAGDPQLAAVVEIFISFDRSLSPVAKVDNEDTMIVGPYAASTDAQGKWATTLVPNGDITPAGSLYKIVETVGSADTVYFISVPDNTTDNWVGDLLVDAPAWE